MSRDYIDDVLYRVQIACIKHRDPSATRTVYDAVAWYIGTGRASLDWVRALGAKKHYKGMITQAMKGYASPDGVISAITKAIGIEQPA